MPTSVVLAKSANGKVQLVTDETRLRLRWSPPGLNRTSLSLGLKNTPANQIRGLELAQYIEDDIVGNRYDLSKEKYRNYFGKPSVPEEYKKGLVDSADLIKKIADYKLERKMMSEATYRNYYMKLHRWLVTNCRDLNEVEIYNLILKDKPPYTAKFFIDYLRNSYNWAIAQGITEVNPFLSMYYPKQILIRKEKEVEIKPFSRRERQLILDAFSEHPYYCYYLEYIKFMFYTGCRPSEASGLLSSKVSEKGIIFDQSVSLTLDGFRITPGTKTETNRFFPVNGQLKEIIRKAKAKENPWNSKLLFPSPKGGRFINVSNFRKRAWCTILKKHTAVEYRSPYNMRHTFITMCLEKSMPVELLAYRCGTSADIIKQHYAGFSQSTVETPEI